MSMAAIAPANAEIKIGVVNATKLMQEAPQAKAVTEALRTEFAGKQRELTAQQAALKAKQEKYEKDGPTMSAEQRARAVANFSRYANDFTILAGRAAPERPPR